MAEANLFVRLLLKVAGFDSELKKSQKSVSEFKRVTEAAAGSVAKLSGGLAAGLGAASLTSVLADITRKSKEFEKSLSGLRSLTGLGAQDMEYFKRAAIEMGASSTQTASQVVEAFKLIGSQQPELLANKEALREVTNQAIILAEAAGMEVPDAARALSGSINQMGVTADRAAEYVNILAAASQKGAADIAYLSAAIEKSGGAASSVGLGYNELVAAIEAIAPKVTDAASAGTNLRNIFLILESSADQGLKPSVVGLGGALDNLRAKGLDATQMTKMFGRESVTAALALVNATDQYKGYVSAITGTNTALEQQRINNDNLEGAINSVASAWEGLVLTMNKSNGFLAGVAKGVTGLIQDLTRLARTEEELGAERIDKAADRMLGRYKGAYEASTAGGVSSSRSAELVAIEYDDNDRWKIEVLKSDLSALGQKLRQLREEPHDRSQMSAVSIEINKTKDLIREKKEQLAIQERLDEKVNDYISSLSRVPRAAGESPRSPESGGATPTGGKASPLEGSIAYYDAQIAALTKELNAATETATRNGIRAAIERANKERYQIELEATLGNLDNLDAPGGGIRVSGRNATDDIKTGYISVSGVTSGAIKSNYEYADSVLAIGSVMRSVSEMTNEGASAWISYGASVTQSVAQALPALSQLASKNAAVAITGAASSVASIPLVGWIMAGAAVASVIAAITNIPRFAGGGIVPGNMYEGDRVPAMLNSGEMVLNRTQQGALFNLLDGGGGLGGGEIHTTVRIDGDKLAVLIDKVNNKKRRVK